MGKEKKIFFIGCAVLIILLAGNVAADSNYFISENSSSFQQNYKEDDVLKGRINISLENYENKEFSDNFGNSIKVFDFLRNSSLVKEVNYFCAPKSCDDGYSISNAPGESEGTLSKSFTFTNANKEKVYGIKINSVPTRINSFTFYINSSTRIISDKQVYVDILGDGINEYRKTNSSSQASESVNNGCFDSSATMGERNVPLESAEKRYFCEKINFTAAPGYRIGAKLKKVTEGTVYLLMYNLNGQLMRQDSSCSIVPRASDDLGNYVAECDIKYSSEKDFQAFVCISKNGSADYKIRFEDNEDKCGFYAKPSGNPNYIGDYELYGGALKYAAIERTQITGNNNKIKEYLNSNYGTTCPDEGCVIPLVIKSEDNREQEITIESAQFSYDTSSGPIGGQINIHELEKNPVKISMNYTMLDIEKMQFKVPNINGRHTWELKFNGENILESKNKTFNVEVGFGFDIGPKSAYLGKKTYFSVIGLENKTIISSSWDFGDGSTEEFEGAYGEHTYINISSAGGYRVSVTLRGVNGESSTKKFRIIVGDVINSVNMTIIEYQTRLTNLDRDIARLPANVGGEFRNRLNLTTMNGALMSIRNRYNNPTGTGDEYYIRLINELVALNVPYSIRINENGSLPAAVGYGNINPSHILTISNAAATSYNTNDLKSAINNWMGTNYDVEVSFSNIVALEEEGERQLIRSYKILLDKKADSMSDEEAYLIIGYPADSTFKALTPASMNKLADGSASYVAISAQGNPNIIEFTIAGSAAPSIETLGIYISPTVDELSVLPSIIPGANRGGFNWQIFLMWTGILLFLAFVAYMALSYWYKFRYEKSLFRNSQDLYNIINFIYNARKSGLGDGEIKKKLEEKKWKGEQITYSFNKIDGKRTGMWEIPIFRFLENKKVKEEIEKQQGGKPLDARFIKR